MGEQDHQQKGDRARMTRRLDEIRRRDAVKEAVGIASANPSAMSAAFTPKPIRRRCPARSGRGASAARRDGTDYLMTAGRQGEFGDKGGGACCASTAHRVASVPNSRLTGGCRCSPSAITHGFIASPEILGARRLQRGMCRSRT